MSVMKFPACLLLAIFLFSCSQLKARLEEGVELSSKQIIPEFNFTFQSFSVFVQEYLYPSYHSKLERRAGHFLDLLASVVEQEQIEPYLSLLIDKKHALPEGYVPGDLVELKEYPELNLARNDLQLRKLLIADLLEMNAAAAAQSIVLVIGSAYRSFAYQNGVFQRYVQRDGVVMANRYSARPGHSQHQLGLTVDFMPISQTFEDTVAGKWLFSHALEYGFSLSYPKDQEDFVGYIYEPWHYRYVGRPIGTLISEYFDDSQQQFFLFWRLAGPELKKSYRSLSEAPGVNIDIYG